MRIWPQKTGEISNICCSVLGNIFVKSIVSTFVDSPFVDSIASTFVDSSIMDSIVVDSIVWTEGIGL